MPGPFALQTQRLFNVFREGIQFGGIFIGQREFPDSLNILSRLAQGRDLGKDRTLRFWQRLSPVGGADNVAVDRGWLGQVEDRVDGAAGTGLTYLNARYYDPVSMRFISPDPLMNPADPTTLDPYRYADNNPVVFMDPSGLAPYCVGSLGRFAAGLLGYSCGATASTAEHVGAISAGVGQGGQEWAESQVRVFTPEGLSQMGSDVTTYGPTVGSYWVAQSVVSTGQQFGEAVQAGTGAYLYNSPNMSQTAAANATPLVIDGVVTSTSLLLSAGSASVAALGPRAAVTGLTRTAGAVKIEAESGPGVVSNSYHPGYSSFSAAKRDLGPAGPGMVYDHVVEQSQMNLSRSGFTANQIHNPANLAPVPARWNQVKANYYASKPNFTGV